MAIEYRSPSAEEGIVPALSTTYRAFGEGVVIGIDANGVVAIRFEDGSERKLMLDYAPLEKLPA